MNRATIEKQPPNVVETSEDIYNIVPPKDKGLVYWEAFTISSPEDQFIDMIRDLPREDEINNILSRLRGPQLLYIERVLSAWISEAEKFLGRDNTRIREKFISLANRWHEETDYLSSPSRITDNDTYLKIISMGESVIPLILQDMQEHGGNWYRALRILSDEDPVSPETRGDIPKMKEAWLRWGRDKGYIK
jgi:hypothetical protein